MAYGSNVFYGHPKDFGCVAGISSTGSYNGAPVVPGKTLEELRANLQAEKCRLAALGWQAADSPVVDPARKDYRLPASVPMVSAGGAAKRLDLRFPWSGGKWRPLWKHSVSPRAPAVSRLLQLKSLK